MIMPMDITDPSPIEHPPARVFRLATYVLDGAQTTPELKAVVGLLKPALAARLAQDKADKYAAERDRRIAKLGGKS